MVVSECCSERVIAICAEVGSYYTCAKCGRCCQTKCSLELGAYDGSKDRYYENNVEIDITGLGGEGDGASGNGSSVSLGDAGAESG